MTTVADVEKVLARARRLSGTMREMRGEGASWDYTFPDGITERYTIKNLKPVENLEDDVSNLFLWAWSTKNYLKELARARRRRPQSIEDLVSRTPALSLVVDVANRLKHPELRDSPRSGYWPQLGSPEYRIGHTALKSVTFCCEGVTIEPTQPDAVEVSYPVLDDSGKLVGDAIVLLESAISYWERTLATL